MDFSVKTFEHYIRLWINKWSDVETRSSRSEFWYPFLAYMIIFVAFQFLSGFIPFLFLFWMVFSFATMIPNLTSAVRRLHDTNQSGWLMLLAIIPVIGFAILIYLLAQPCVEGENKFGAAPKDDI